MIVICPNHDYLKEEKSPHREVNDWEPDYIRL